MAQTIDSRSAMICLTYRCDNHNNASLASGSKTRPPLKGELCCIACSMKLSILSSDCERTTSKLPSWQPQLKPKSPVLPRCGRHGIVRISHAKGWGTARGGTTTTGRGTRPAAFSIRRQVGQNNCAQSWQRHTCCLVRNTERHELHSATTHALYGNNDCLHAEHTNVPESLPNLSALKPGTNGENCAIWQLRSTIGIEEETKTHTRRLLGS